MAFKRSRRDFLKTSLALVAVIPERVTNNLTGSGVGVFSRREGGALPKPAPSLARYSQYHRAAFRAAHEGRRDAGVTRSPAGED